MDSPGLGNGRRAQPAPPAHLPNLQLQPPHLGLPLRHHGLQLGDEAAAPLSLVVELLVQAVLRRTCLFLLQTQAPQNLLQLLQLVLGGRAGGQARVSHSSWVRKDKGRPTPPQPATHHSPCLREPNTGTLVSPEKQEEHLVTHRRVGAMPVSCPQLLLPEIGAKKAIQGAPGTTESSSDGGPSASAGDVWVK